MKSLTPLLMRILLCVFLPALPAGSENTVKESPPPFLLDLSKLEPSQMDISTDRVMGGISTASLKRSDQGELVFFGKFSLENNGGFTSLWFGEGSYDLSAFQGIRLRVKGDGRPYHLQIETDERTRGEPVSFRAEFKTSSGEWVDRFVPFHELKPYWRGRRLDKPFDPARIETFGIILLDKHPGPFEIRISELGAF